jgi:hypothetical protein
MNTEDFTVGMRGATAVASSSRASWTFVSVRGSEAVNGTASASGITPNPTARLRVADGAVLIVKVVDVSDAATGAPGDHRQRPSEPRGGTTESLVTRSSHVNESAPRAAVAVSDSVNVRTLFNVEVVKFEAFVVPS